MLIKMCLDMIQMCNLTLQKKVFQYQKYYIFDISYQWCSYNKYMEYKYFKYMKNACLLTLS